MKSVRVLTTSVILNGSNVNVKPEKDQIKMETMLILDDRSVAAKKMLFLFA